MSQQYDVYHKPARGRILGEIQLLHEEFSSALAMRAGQVEAVCNFGWIGQESYRISNQYRNQQYDLETDVGQDCVDQLILEREDLKLLLTRLATLEQKVRYRVKILEEDNSKAIFIFTVVAAIFLPLSFVSSYLGMNTIDIRDMNNSQSTF
jgi:Mg2+ and Co2+ transporter CorA